MIALLLILALLLPVPASAMQMIGYGAGGCASQSVIINGSQWWDSANTTSGNTTTGQSFSYGSPFTLYSITVLAYSGNGATGTLTMRVSASADLQAGYIEAATAAIVGAGDDDYYEFVFAGQPSMSASTPYYWGITSNDDPVDIYKSNTSVYADGIAYYGTVTLWDMASSDAGLDRNMQVKKCD
jgi:hypothetical protein